MKNEEIINRIETLDSLLFKLGRRDYDAVEYLKQLHSDVFGKPFDGNCPNCIQKAYKTLKSLTIENLEIMESKKYHMKPGKLIRIAYTGEAYTNENITDRVAQKLLKDRPERIELFSKFPSDWKGLKEEKAPAKKVVAKKAAPVKEAAIEVVKEEVKVEDSKAE